MREIFLDIDNVKYGLTQAYSKIIREGLDSYTMMGIGGGGTQIVKGLIDCGFSGKALSCSFENEEHLAQYLFSWENIPGNDNERLIEFLMQNFNIEWIKAAKINKNDDDKTIRITNDANFLSLTLNNEKNTVDLEIDDVRTDKFIVKTENGELNIYLALNKSDILDEKILVCEDTTITGKSFKQIYDQLRALGADDVKLFSFLMRRDSSIVPNIFIFETEKDAKVYFPWSSYPIRIYSKGIIRKITSSDIEKNFKCGDPRIDKRFLAEYYKEYKNQKAKVYLVEDDYEICSIIKFYEIKHGNYNGLFLDEIATAEEKQGKKYAHTLLKLIINYMYYHEFDFIYGYAFDEVLTMYKKINFQVIGSVQVTNYGTLHKVATVHNRKKPENDLLIATLQSNI